MKEETQNRVSVLLNKLSVYKSHLKLAETICAYTKDGFIGSNHELDKSGNFYKHEALMKKRVCADIKKKISETQKELDRI